MLVERRAVVVWAVIVTVLPGCAGYYSQYVPPDSSRVRPVWRDDTLVAVGPATLPECDLNELTHLTAGDEEPPTKPPPMALDESGRWHPVGGPDVGVGFYAAPWDLPHRLLVRQVLLRKRRAGRVSAGSGSGSRSNPEAADLLPDDADELATVVAVLLVGAIVASVPVALALAIGDPEDEEGVALAVDEVNRQNDAVRRWISACARQAQQELMERSAPSLQPAPEPVQAETEPAPGAPGPAPAPPEPPAEAPEPVPPPPLPADDAPIPPPPSVPQTTRVVPPTTSAPGAAAQNKATL